MAEAENVKFSKEEDIKPLANTFKQIFSPITKIGPAIIKIPKELKRIGDNLKEDVESGIPEKFEKACDKLENANEKFVMDFGGQVLKQAKEQREAATTKAQKLTEAGVPAVVTKNNEVKQLNQKEILGEQVKLLKVQEKLSIKEKERDVLVKQANDGDVDVKDKLAKVLDTIAKLEEVQQARQERLGPEMTPRRGEEGEEDYIPGPIREFGESLTEIVTGPFVAFQELGNNVKEFAKPFKALTKNMEKFGGDGEEDEGSPLGFLGVMFLKLGKIVKMIATFFMVTFLPIFLKVAGVIAVAVGAFTLIKGAIEMLISAVTGAYNYFASFVPGVDPIGASEDEKTMKRAKDRGITSTSQMTDEELKADAAIKGREADVGDIIGFKETLLGESKRETAEKANEELKFQTGLRSALGDRVGSNPMMNIINNQTNSNTSVETKVSPRPSTDNVEAITS